MYRLLKKYKTTGKDVSFNKETPENKLREFLITVLTDKIPDQLKKVNFNYKMWLAKLNPRKNPNFIATVNDKWIKQQ